MHHRNHESKRSSSSENGGRGRHEMMRDGRDHRGFDGERDRSFDDRGYDDRDFPRRNDADRFVDDGGFEGSFERSFQPSYNPWDRDDRPSPGWRSQQQHQQQDRAWRDSAARGPQQPRGRGDEGSSVGWSPYDPDYNLRSQDRGRFGERGGSSDDWQRDRGGSSSSSSTRARPQGQRFEPGEQIGTRRMGSGAGKGVKGYKRSDERIREDVCDRIGDMDVDASDVEVSVKDGEVTLSGTIPERHMKYAIEQCCERVSGVNDVTNQLRLKRESSSSSMSTASSMSRDGDDTGRNGSTSTARPASDGLASSEKTAKTKQ